MTKNSRMVLGLIGAMAAGVAIGLLVAPEKGSKTRKKLKRKTAGIADAVGHIFSRSAEGVEKMKDNLKKQKESILGE